MKITFMSSRLKTVILSFILSVLITNFSIAEERFCLDETGFIYPLFTEKNCDDNTEELITKNEFNHLIDLSQNLRVEKLTEIRNNPKIYAEEKAETKIVTETKTPKKNLTTHEKRKLELEQKKLARLANELKKKEEFKIKKEKRLLEQKKRLAELASKRLAKKKEKELKKQKRLEEIERKKKEKELKILARKKEQELRKLQALERKNKVKEKKETKTIAKQKIIDEQNLGTGTSSNQIENQTISHNLKVAILDNDIVNKELLPNIDGELENLIDPSKEIVEQLFKYNKNLIVLIPRDFQQSSVRVSENKMLSQQVIGIDQIPNPEINRIEAELRRAEQDYLIAERKFQRGTAAATNYNPYGGWASVLNQWAGLAEQSAAGKERANARQRLERWSAKLSSTPMYLEKERLGSYKYDVAIIKSEKKSIYDVIKFNKDNYNLIENFYIKEQKDFKIAYGISSQDKNFKKLNNQYSSENDLSEWNNVKMKNLTDQTLLMKINNNQSSRKIKSRDAFKLLGNENSNNSFWSNLFSSKPKNKSKISSKSYETKDLRFDSVVVIKSPSGMGSGFFISSDEILTNYHVVENAMSISIIDKNKKKSSAVIIKKDLKRDLALLKTNMKGKPVTFFNGKLKQGDMVEALGHPKGRKFSLTKGWISAVRKESSTYNATNSKDVLFIQTDAAINPGNSGGPLFLKNKVVGVNTQGLHKDTSEGMNFAVHFSEVQKFLSQ